MRSLLLLTPLLAAFATGTLVFEQTQLFRDQTTPFVKQTFVPAIPDATCMALELEGASYHEIQWITFGWGNLELGPRTYAQAAFFRPDVNGPAESDPRLFAEVVEPPLVTSWFPPGTTITLIEIADFHASSQISDSTVLEELADGSTIEWAGNSLVSGVSSGGGNFAFRSRTRHTLRGTVRVYR